MGQKGITQPFFNVLRQFRTVIDFQGKMMIPREEILDVKAYTLESKIAEQVIDLLQIFLVDTVGVGRILSGTDQIECIRAVEFTNKPIAIEG